VNCSFEILFKNNDPIFNFWIIEAFIAFVNLIGVIEALKVFPAFFS
jgi:hypothetical protein